MPYEPTVIIHDLVTLRYEQDVPAALVVESLNAFAEYFRSQPQDYRPGSFYGYDNGRVVRGGGLQRLTIEVNAPSADQAAVAANELASLDF